MIDWVGRLGRARHAGLGKPTNFEARDGTYLSR